VLIYIASHIYWCKQKEALYLLFILATFIFFGALVFIGGAIADIKIGGADFRFQERSDAR
jgi:hypothetical protein